MSLLHIVLFSLHAGVQAKDPRVTDAAQLSAEHPRYIPEIREWWSGFDVSGRDIAADFMVMGVFDSVTARDRYLAHPHHREGVRAWADLADWKVIDVDEDVARSVESTTEEQAGGE